MRWFGGGCLLLFGAGLVQACLVWSPEKDDGSWVCFQAADACWCGVVTGSSRFASSGREVSRCGVDFSCCLLTEGPEGEGCRCDFDDAASCDAEAASRRDASRVPMCPPGAENMPVACADLGENCSLSYLRDQRLDGCCEGSVCDGHRWPDLRRSGSLGGPAR